MHAVQTVLSAPVSATPVLAATFVVENVVSPLVCVFESQQKLPTQIGGVPTAAPAEVKVESSPDGVTWTNLTSTLISIAAGGIATRNIISTARFLRVSCRSTNANANGQVRMTVSGRPGLGQGHISLMPRTTKSGFAKTGAATNTGAWPAFTAGAWPE